MESTVYVNHMSSLKRSNRRYRKLSMFLFALVFVLVFVLVFSNQSAAYDGYKETYESVMIAPGDTLWSIAEEYKVPGTSTRKLVRQLKHINGMSGSDLKYGNYLIVPVYVSYDSLACLH